MFVSTDWCARLGSSARWRQVLIEAFDTLARFKPVEPSLCLALQNRLALILKALQRLPVLLRFAAA